MAFIENKGNRSEELIFPDIITFFLSVTEVEEDREFLDEYQVERKKEAKGNFQGQQIWKVHFTFFSLSPLSPLLSACAKKGSGDGRTHSDAAMPSLLFYERDRRGFFWLSRRMLFARCLCEVKLAWGLEGKEAVLKHLDLDPVLPHSLEMREREMNVFAFFRDGFLYAVVGILMQK